MDEYLISRLYTDARVQRIYGGTSEIMKEVIARALLKEDDRTCSSTPRRRPSATTCAHSSARRLPPNCATAVRKGLRPSREQVVAWQRALHERGWAAPHWPREFGGADLASWNA
jgi:alkylation response protein AidB-like acyl-CoA dehydrogenase